MNSKVLTLDIDPGWSDNEIRQQVKTMPNGEYACFICRQCGIYRTKEDGHADSAEIKPKCRECFDRISS